MNELSLVNQNIPACTPVSLEKLRQLETAMLQLPQVPVQIEHTLHGGMYARTARVPAGCFILGALIKVPTVLIVSGSCVMYTSNGPERIDGYRIFAAEPGRKQAFYTETDTELTMVFRTSAETVSQAEEEFTDEFMKLTTRNRNVQCPELPSPQSPRTQQ